MYAAFKALTGWPGSPSSPLSPGAPSKPCRRKKKWCHFLKNNLKMSLEQLHSNINSTYRWTWLSRRTRITRESTWTLKIKPIFNQKHGNCMVSLSKCVLFNSKAQWVMLIDQSASRTYNTLLKIKVLYWHQWVHEEHCTKGSYCIRCECSGNLQDFL